VHAPDPLHRARAHHPDARHSAEVRDRGTYENAECRSANAEVSIESEICIRSLSQAERGIPFCVHKISRIARPMATAHRGPIVSSAGRRSTG
jgi:hypothetical protein